MVIFSKYTIPMDTMGYTLKATLGRSWGLKDLSPTKRALNGVYNSNLRVVLVHFPIGSMVMVYLPTFGIKIQPNFR